MFRVAKTRIVIALSALLTACPLTTATGIVSMAEAANPAPSFTFASIDGGKYDTSKWRGLPILVVNTASMCGYTPQYTELQQLSDAYEGRAIVLVVPSDDFNQELSSNDEVKDFCDLNYKITLPMTEISHVARGDLHPFYAWVRAETGFVPGWNFNKVLIGADGSFVKSWGSNATPLSAEILSEIDKAIAAGG